MPLDPVANRVSVSIDDSAVVRTLPDGRTERITWDDLQEVVIETNDAGLSFTERNWVLVGSIPGTACTLPAGFEGEKTLLERLKATPGFDTEAYNAAMISTFDGKFLCWHRLL